MAEFLKKELTYKEIKGSSYKVWVPGTTKTEKKPIYGPSYTTGGNPVTTDSHINCTFQTVDANPLTGEAAYDVELCETVTETGTTPVIVVPGEIIGYETTSTQAPGHFETKTTSDFLIPLNANQWNSSAASASSFFRDGSFKFDVVKKGSVFVAGLNLEADAGGASGYTDIKHGFFVRADSFDIVENGEIVESISTTPLNLTFEIILQGSTVEYKADGATWHTSTSLFPVNSYVKADVALYSAEAQIHNSELTQLPFTSIPSFEVEFKTISSMRNDDVFNFTIKSKLSLGFEFTDVVLATEFKTKSKLEAFASVVPVSYGRADMQPFESFATDHNVAIGGFDMQPLEVEAVSGEEVQNSSFGYSILNIFDGAGTGLTGGTTIGGGFDMHPFELFAADHEVARGGFDMHPFEVKAGKLPELVFGVCNISTTLGFGNATLLESGKHLITAAHVVENMEASQIDVEWYASNFFYVSPAEVEKIEIHPLYESTYAGGVLTKVVYDVAILTLKNVVNPLVRRHSLYTGSDDVGATYTRLSRTFQLDPLTGQKGAKEWSETRNIYEVYGEDLDQYLPFENVPNQTLAYDFDNGTTTQDAFQKKFGISQKGIQFEGRAQPGDSGSAGFVGDGVIATVASYGFSLGAPIDSDNITNSTYGEVGVDARVSDFSEFINDAAPEIQVQSPTIAYGHITFNTGIKVKGYGKFPVKEGAHLKFKGLKISGESGSFARLKFQKMKVSGLVGSFDTGGAHLKFQSLKISGLAQALNEGIAHLKFQGLKISGESGSYAHLKLKGLKISGEGTSYPTGSGHLKFQGLKISGEVLGSGAAAHIKFKGLALVTGGEGRLKFKCLTLATQSVDHELEGFKDSDEISAIAINTKLFETTEYANYSFLKIERYQGKYYGIKEDGVYLLEGEKDSSEIIRASFKLHRFDFKIEQQKRVPYVYLDSVNAVKITSYAEEVRGNVFKEEAKVGVYSSSKNGRKTTLGKGAKGRYWGFKVTGKQFIIRSIKFLISKSNRRI